jgi:hypothetical protein
LSILLLLLLLFLLLLLLLLILRQDSWDSRDGAHPYDDYNDDFSEALADYLAEVPAAERGYWDSRDGAHPYEDYNDDFSESATSGDTDMPESLVDYLAEVPAAERGYCLWREYVLARRRWRNFNNSSTRFERRSLRRKGKGKGRGGESKDKRSGNPHGQHGDSMKCHNCDSDQHMIQKPTRRSSRRGEACTSTMASGHVHLLWLLGVERVIKAGGNPIGNSDVVV